ncbi:hypothetical protein [Anaerostipes sp.]|uniref:hypothetical protein n=1 Tax=Anaerostipes sp. TaxID=1872530 RepID=UPI003FF02774
MFGKKKKHSQHHSEYKVKSENLAVPEVYIGQEQDNDDKTNSNADKDHIVYDNVAIPEIHIKKK